MSATKQADSARPSAGRGRATALLLGGGLLGIGLGVALAFNNLAGEPQAAPAWEVRTSQTVVTAVRNMARLETASMRLQKVVDLRDRQSRFWGSVQVTDAVLLIASADVRAGVDLSHFEAGDIKVNDAGSSVRMKLPAAQIFSVALNSKETYVYSRTTDVLATHNASLETRARQMAVEMLKESAKKSDVTDLAQRNAEHVLRTLILAMGFEKVEFEKVEFEKKPPMTGE